MKIIAKLHAVDKDIVEFYSPKDNAFPNALLATVHIDYFFTFNDSVHDRLTDGYEVELELKEI